MIDKNDMLNQKINTPNKINIKIYSQLYSNKNSALL